MKLCLCWNTGAWPLSTSVPVVIPLYCVLLLHAHTHTHTHTHVCVYETRCSCGDEYKDYGCFGCAVKLHCVVSQKSDPSIYSPRDTGV